MTRQQLERLIESYAAAHAEFEPMRLQLDQMKKEVCTAVEALGETVQAAGWQAYVSADYQRTAWDSKGLELMSQSLPAILQCRSQKLVRGGGRIKRIKGGQ